MDADPDTLKTRWTLVARLKNLDDQASWEEFHALYRPVILGVARKAGLRPDEAEEVAQETMASLAGHIEEFVASPERGKFRAWLLNMARWRITDQLRKRQPASLGSDAATEGTARTPTVERVADQEGANLEALCDAEWERQIKVRALKELQGEVKAEHYQIFFVLALERKSIEEVARMVGSNRARIYVIKHRVGNKFARILRELEKKLG